MPVSMNWSAQIGIMNNADICHVSKLNTPQRNILEARPAMAASQKTISVLRIISFILYPSELIRIGKRPE